jgi:hypothetical protein
VRRVSCLASLALGNIRHGRLTTAQPTLAWGKGWGDFDIQSTISVQIPVGALNVPGGASAQTNIINFGDPILWNTAFQYHLFKYFWPELEVNYEYWPNGEHVGLNQVLLPPGLILGRFQIGNDTPTRPINLIIGAGYQMAVTPKILWEPFASPSDESTLSQKVTSRIVSTTS